MSDLLDHLHALQPASLWTLAPKPQLMQAAGMIAVGDIADLHWTGTGQLEIEFPQRMDTLIHRLRLEQRHLVGSCDQHRPQPCVHHLASLMLCAHLLKDFGAFGRLPNRVLAARLKAKLLRQDERAVVAERPKREAQRHVLIRPTHGQLFAFRDSFSEHAQDAFATQPQEVKGFTSAWGILGSVEDAFWKWFSDPLRRFPVFIELDNQVLSVDQGHVSGWQGDVVLSLDTEGLRMKRRLSRHGELVQQPFVPVGQSLLYLVESKHLIRLSQSWQAWHRITSELRQHSFPALHSAGLGKKDAWRDHVSELPIELREWNHAGIDWWQGSELAMASSPALHWQGQTIAQPPQVKARGSIQLFTDGQQMLRVLCRVHAHGADLPVMDSMLRVEQVLAISSRDSLLFSSKARRDAILNVVFRAALTPPGKERRLILREIEYSPGFRVASQAKACAKVLKEFFEQLEQSQPAQLCASTEHGWHCVTESQTVALVTAALARHVLGGMTHEDMENPPRREPGDTALLVPLMDALPRLSALVAACQAHDIELTYEAQPIAVTTLKVRISAQQATGMNFFELKPQVICSGGLIPQAQWEELLTKGHLIDGSGQMQVIDMASLDGLTRMAEALGRHRGELPDKAARKELAELVRIPRVRILDWLMLSKHGIECELPESERGVLDSLMSFESLDREPLPQLKITPRDYQHAGYSWMAFLYRHGFGACLADDMGLGKTLQTIILLAAIKEGLVKPLADDGVRRPHLLVVPPSLLFNWQHEVKNFCPGLYVHEYTGKGRSLIGIREGVVLTTYDIARRDIETLRNAEFDCIIFDEAQNVKNLTGERSKAMRQLQGRFKLVLTGTPLENHAGEYYSIIDLALPGLFGDYKAFMDALKSPNGHFHPLDRARPFVLRRTKDKILKELPPKVESDLHLDLSEEQKRFYTRAVADVRQEVFEAFEGKSAQQAGIVALAALTRLRQICISPALIDPTHTEMSPKMQHLVEKLEELAAEGHSALVFSQFTKSLDLLEKHLTEAKIQRLRLDGSTPQEKRKLLVEAFQNGKGPGIFLISLKAGGAGLNLTRASYVFHIDPWWNPAVESQASDRAHRMGQKQTVFIQRLLMRHTVEEKIMLLKAQKKELFDRVLSGNEGDRGTSGAIITRNDFKFLLE